MRPLPRDELAASAADVPLDSGAPESGGPTRSLMGDIEALIEDARTWFDAEIGYQKSRAGFVASRAKVLVGLGLGALFFLIMALFGLTVGLIIALTPLITAWGATAVVVGLLLVGALVMLRKTSGVWRSMMSALDEKADKKHG
jgi:hypothetical protein